jgi:hypothetical protein
LNRLIETAYRENLNLRVTGVRVLAGRTTSSSIMAM